MLSFDVTGQERAQRQQERMSGPEERHGLNLPRRLDGVLSIPGAEHAGTSGGEGQQDPIGALQAVFDLELLRSHFILHQPRRNRS